MSGVKITELPVSGTLEKTDLTYVVDVSSDTSKQATIQKIIDAVDQVGITDVDGFAFLQAADSFGLKVESDNPLFQGLYYNEDNSANYTDDSLIARKDAPKVILFNDTPCNQGEAPIRVGDFWVDTNRNEMYYSDAVVDCNSWKKLVPTIPILSSGTWTPTLSDFTGCVVDATLVYAFYSQIDNIVTCTIHATVDLNFSLAGGNGYLEYTKPIATSTFTPIGVGQLYKDSTNCNISSNTSKMYFYSTSSANIGFTSFTFSFQYEIV